MDNTTTATATDTTTTIISMEDPNSVRPDPRTVTIAFALVLGAGMATAIGASVVIVLPKLITNHHHTNGILNRYVLASSLGMSAGVMIYVSLIEIVPKSRLAFIAAGYAENLAYVYATACFFAGVVIMMILNALVTHFLHTTSHSPSAETAHQPSNVARPQRGNLRSHDDPAASAETSNGEVGHPPTTTTAPTATWTPVTTNSNTDSMIDSGHFDHHHHHHHNNKHHTLNQRRPPEPPHICCSSDDPVRDLEVLQQMAEILVAEQELRERKPRKATRMMEDESPMKHTTHTEIQELPILDDTNIHHHGNSDLMLPVEDAIESNSAKRSGSAGIHNDRTNDSHNDEGDDDNDDHSQNHHQQHATQRERQLLLRMSMNTAVAIGLHNFPEGLATFVATLDDPHVGFVLAVAIAIHNIPEGLCVALPVYYATGSRRKAFGWAILSGLSEPLAAVFGYIILANAVTSTTYGILFGIIAGMMVMISTRELLPTAHRYDPTDRVVTYSFIFGMAVLALSLVLFVL